MSVINQKKARELIERIKQAINQDIFYDYQEFEPDPDNSSYKAEIDGLTQGLPGKAQAVAELEQLIG